MLEGEGRDTVCFFWHFHFFKFGWDESGQLCLGKIAPVGSDKAKEIMENEPRSFRRKGMIVSTEVAHSEIMTAKVTFWNVVEAEKDREPKEVLPGEECVLAPVSVADLRHQTLAVAIFRNFELMFGKRIAEFVNTLNFCGLVVLVFACDYASTNTIVVSWIRRILEVCEVIVWVHFERCGLHQLACIIKDLTTQHSMSRQMRALGKTMRNRRNQQRFSRELAKCVGPDVQFNGPVKAAAALEVASRHKQAAMSLMSSVSNHEQAVARMRAAQGMADHAIHSNRRDACLRSLFTRCNNWDIALDPTLNVTETLITEEAVRKEITDDVLGVVLSCGWEQYSDARWTKQIPALRKWCACALLPPVRKAWLSCRFACETGGGGGGAAAGQADKRAAEGIKIRIAREWIGHDLWVPRLVMVCCLVDYMERFGRVLFSASPVGWVSRDGFDELTPASTESTSGSSPASGPAAAERDPARAQAEAPRADIGDVVDEAENMVCELWNMLSGDVPSHDVAWSLAVACYPKAGRFAKDIHNFVFTDVFCVISGFIMRFCLRHQYEPYSNTTVRRGHGKARDRAGCRKSLQKPECCTGHVKAQLQYAKKMDTGEQSQSEQTETRIKRMVDAQIVWEKQVQAATIAQERPHAEQRYQGNLESRVPQSFARQSANMVRTNVKRLWNERGGRDLSIAESGLRTEYATAMQQRTIHRRPNQCGDPFFFWVQLQPLYQQVALLDY